MAYNNYMLMETSDGARRRFGLFAICFGAILPFILIFVALFLTFRVLWYSASPDPNCFEARLISSRKSLVGSANYLIAKNTYQCASSTIIYPITGHQNADRTLSDIAQQTADSFLNSISDHASSGDRQEIEFTRLPVGEPYISIILHEAGTSTIQTLGRDRFFTLDQYSGEMIKVAQIVKDPAFFDQYGDARTVQNILNSSFAVDAMNEQLLVNIDGAERSIKFDEIRGYLPFSVARDLFGMKTLIEVAADNIDCSVLKCIALTFDDGPGSETNRLLDILKATGAKASFFTLGHLVPHYSAQVARASNEGHDVGSHSWNHKNLPRFGYGQIAHDLNATTNAIQAAAGQRVKYFRPPYGNINSSVRQIVRGMNQEIVLWTIDPQDWKYKDANHICQHVVARAQPGSIVLLHDIYPTSVDAAKCIIENLSFGFAFVNLSTLYR